MQSVGEITGLDIALKRISSIESNFNKLLCEEKTQAANDFKEILDETIKGNDSVKLKGKIGTEAINDLIEKYSLENGVDPDFVRAVVKHESGFNPNATSKAGAMGLMQLMPGTARGLGVIDAYNPEQNINGGVKYLKSMMNKFGGSQELALAAYNAGPGAVQKYGGIPPYQETQNYVKNIMATYNRIKQG